MAEIEREMRTVQVRMQCENTIHGEPCKGEMLPTGMCLTSNPAWYPHTCNNDGCGATKQFRVQYPHIKYVPLGQGQD